MDDELNIRVPSSGNPPSLSNLSLGGSRPVGIPSRPGRYDQGVDTAPLTPPSSSHNLELVFDSSKIYENHPRKYRLLLEREQGSRGTSEGGQSTTTSGPHGIIKGQAGAPPASCTVKDGQIVAMGGALGSSQTPADTASAEVLPAADVQRASAPSALSGLKPAAQGGRRDSGKDSDFSTAAIAGSRYIPQEFLKSFTAKAVVPPISRAGTESMNTQSASSFSSGPAALPSSGGPSQGASATSGTGMGGSQSSCVRVQPEPRRLFGFGPLYRPLPETVCNPPGNDDIGQPKMRRNQTSPDLEHLSSLSEAVRQEGFTGAGYSGARRSSAFAVGSDLPDGGVGAPAAPKKTTLSPAELNSWLPGGF